MFVRIITEKSIAESNENEISGRFSVEREIWQFLNIIGSERKAVNICRFYAPIEVRSSKNVTQLSSIAALPRSERVKFSNTLIYAY